MIAPVTPKQEKILQLTVELTRTQPVVRRRLLVPASYSLGELHDVIQTVMPWQGYHCHVFRVGKQRYGEPDDESPSVEDEESLTLAEVFRGKTRQVVYEYDFGDSWEHVVTLEKRVQPDPETEYPVCIDGQNACPPEDAGGTEAYYAKLAILRDPGHEDHERIAEWFGDGFDPAHFDPAEANEALRYDPSTPDPGEEDDGIEPVSSAEVEGLCAWCGRRTPRGRPAIALNLSLCQRINLGGLEGTYVLVPLPGGDAAVPALVPDSGGDHAGGGHTVVATLCCEPCAQALRNAWGHGEKTSEPNQPES